MKKEPQIRLGLLPLKMGRPTNDQHRYKKTVISSAGLIKETVKNPLVSHALTTFDAAIRKVEPPRKPANSHHDIGEAEENNTEGKRSNIMAQLNSPISRLIDAFASLPSIGKKSAERLAYHVLKMPNEEAIEFAESIRAVKENLRPCKNCFNLTENDECDICKDPPPRSKRLVRC